MIRIPSRHGTVGAAPQARPPNPGAAAVPVEATAPPGQTSPTTEANTTGALVAEEDHSAARVVFAVGGMVALGWLATKAFAP